MGLVVSAKKNGKEYLGLESLDDPNRFRGLGLANEFSFFSPEEFIEKNRGEYFNKMGVGLLKKTEDKYDFMFEYKAIYDKIDCDFGNDYANFKTRFSNDNGIDYEIIKKISLNGSEIIIQYEIENFGQKAMDSNEYCHNFICLNNGCIDENYLIELSSDINNEEIHDYLKKLTDNALGIKHKLNDSFYMRLSNSCENYKFKIINNKSKISLSETVDFTPDFVAIWGTTHVLSVEMFKKLYLKKGEIAKYKRVYTLGTEG